MEGIGDIQINAILHTESSLDIKGTVKTEEHHKNMTATDLVFHPFYRLHICSYLPTDMI